MKIFLYALAMIIFLVGNVEAADLSIDLEKVFIARRFVTPPAFRKYSQENLPATSAAPSDTTLPPARTETDL